MSEDESVPHQEKEKQAGSSSQTPQTPSLFEQARKDVEAIPPEVEVKVEVDEMTQEEFEYFGTTNLTFSQAQMLDAMRANSRVGKGKVDMSQDPWAFKVRNLHPPSGTIPVDASSSRLTQSVGMDEAADMRRAISGIS